MNIVTKNHWNTRKSNQQCIKKCQICKKNYILLYKNNFIAKWDLAKMCKPGSKLENQSICSSSEHAKERKKIKWSYH